MTNSKVPLETQRLSLKFQSVLVRCLDDKHRELAHASGFIRREEGRYFLYTCWHVVTGLDRNDLRVPNHLPDREYLSVEMQTARVQPGVTRIGGTQSVVLPLYSTDGGSRLPLWQQDKRHKPHPDLNAVNLFVPFWHDAVRIELPPSTVIPDIQVLDEYDVFPMTTLLTPGDKLYIVGFPYSFSADGDAQPSAVALTRFVAATQVSGRHREFLLESIGAPGMSGGPVFVERAGSLLSIGLYTGLLYPDSARGGNEKYTALGTCSDLCLHLWGHLPFVSLPDEC